MDKSGAAVCAKFRSGLAAQVNPLLSLEYYARLTHKASVKGRYRAKWRYKILYANAGAKAGAKRKRRASSRIFAVVLALNLLGRIKVRPSNHLKAGFRLHVFLSKPVHPHVFKELG